MGCALVVCRESARARALARACERERERERARARERARERERERSRGLFRIGVMPGGGNTITNHSPPITNHPPPTHRPTHHCRYIDFYDEEKYYYLITEEVSGGELFDRIVEKTVYDEHEVRLPGYVKLSSEGHRLVGGDTTGHHRYHRHTPL